MVDRIGPKKCSANVRPAGLASARRVRTWLTELDRTNQVTTKIPFGIKSYLAALSNRKKLALFSALDGEMGRGRYAFLAAIKESEVKIAEIRGQLFVDFVFRENQMSVFKFLDKGNYTVADSDPVLHIFWLASERVRKELPGFLHISAFA